jgi:hypothetical protein
MNPLSISMEQMIALHSFFAEAAATGEACVSESSGCETEIEVVEIRCTPLGEFGERGLLLSEDLVAGVMGRVDGGLPGSLNLVMEPEDALAWAQVGGAVRDPIASFVSLGSEVLAGMCVALADVLRAEVEFRDAVLVESPELAMLIQTHAPSDTLALSVKLRIDCRGEVLMAHSHWLVEPKYLSRLLSALSAALH